MSWNNRLVKTAEGWGVHEVYYDEDGKPKYWTAEPVDLGGHEDPKEAYEAVIQIATDLTRHPALWVVGDEGEERLSEKPPE